MASLTLQDIYQIALRAGLGEQGARAAVAIAQTEGGLSGQVGDSGQSFGPFQFYTQGMLPAFAKALGVDAQQAAQVASQQPQIAAQWALTGYLGEAIKAGQQQGLTGANLATYAQTNGQRSQSPERAGANYTALFGQQGDGQMGEYDQADERTGPVVTGSTYDPATPPTAATPPAPGSPEYYRAKAQEAAALYDYATAQRYEQMARDAEAAIGGGERPGGFTIGGTRYEYSRGRDGKWAPYAVATAPASSGPSTLNTDTGDAYIVQRNPDGSVSTIPNPNYRQPAPTRDPNQPAPRYPEDAEYARLRNQQLQQQLQNPLQLAMQQQNEALAAIQQKLAAGEIDVAEANRLMSLTRANLDSTLQGTTPWQQKTQQQNLARGVLGDRMQTGSSLAQGLLSGFGNVYGKVLSSSNPPNDFDPMLLAKGFVNDMGGGPEMGELAKAILSGALKPQGF